MLMELMGKLRFLNEYGELENVKPGYWKEASTGAAVGASGTGGCRLFPSWKSSLCSLDKMAWCAVSPLMVGYGNQG